MNYADIVSRVEALRRELAEIADHNRQYFAKKSHSPEQRAQHQELQERVREIRAELYGLKERKAARHGRELFTKPYG